MSCRFAGLVLLLAITGGACAGADAATGPRGLLYVNEGSDVRAVSLDTGRTVFAAPGARPAFDWSRLYSARQEDGATLVSRLDPRDGKVLASQAVQPGLVVRAVSADGRTVALAAPALRDRGYRPAPRAETQIVLIRDDGPPRRLVVAGNLEPEEFSADGESLFVLEFTPALEPVKYQVRELDVATGQVDDVSSPDKDLQRAMGATARTQALSPDGTRLYTLYTLTDAEDAPGGQRAFVHVLDLAGKWAHCVELPRPFGNVPDAAAAIAVSGDGRHVYVYDGRSGRVADVDSVRLRVRHVASSGPAAATTAAATMLQDGGLAVAGGRRVVVLDAESLARRQTWTASRPVADLQGAPDSDALFVATHDGVAIVDPATGAERRRIGVRDVSAISRVGSAPRIVVSSREVVQCAC
jgi:hypothetical protein